MIAYRGLLALMLVMVAVLLAAGCGERTNNFQGNTTLNPTTSGLESSTAKISGFSPAEDKIAALQSYRNNLTPTRRKIPERILTLIDPNYPTAGMTPEQTRSIMISLNQIIPADQAKKVFNISNGTGQPIGDQIHLIIYLRPTANLKVIDPLVTAVIIRNEEYHAVSAWVEINNIEKLASIDDVTRIELNSPPEHS